MRHFCPRQGFTLIEIMLSLSILILLSSLGLPAYDKLMSRHRLNAATVRVMSDLILARKRALSQQHSVQMLFKGTQSYDIWDDRNNDNNRQNQDEMTNKDLSSFGVLLKSNNHPRFWPSGSVTNLATIELRHPGVANQKSRCITISITGRIKQDICVNKI